MQEQLKRKFKHLALLDAVIEQEWEYRYYSFDSAWSDSEEMASVRDGSGGECFLHFHNDNVAFKCTSPVDGLFADFDSLKSTVPKRFSSFIAEPAFSMDMGSCIWYLENDSWVKLGSGIKDLPTPETILAMSAAEYCKYVESYFERSIDTGLVELVFEGKFKIDMAQQLNDSVDLELLAKDITQIGEIT